MTIHQIEVEFVLELKQLLILYLRVDMFLGLDKYMSSAIVCAKICQEGMTVSDLFYFIVVSVYF